MATNVVDLSPLQRQEIKTLGANTGPCLTIMVPLNRTEPNDRHAELRLKSALQKAEQVMTEGGLQRNDVDMMLEPIREFSGQEGWAAEGEGLVILRSPDLFRTFPVPVPVKDAVVFADHFHILPVLPALTTNKHFYILALSQKHIRMLRCTDHSSMEVSLPDSVPKNLQEFLQIDPERPMLSSASGGGIAGAKIGAFGTNDLDKQDEYLYHFYKAVSEGVREFLKNDPGPVVPAGVEYEIAVLRRANTIPNLSEHAVFGSPESLKGGDLHARALEAVAPDFDAPLRRALDLYEKNGGTDRATADARQVVKAAYETRVAHLFLGEGAKLMGNFDEVAHRVHMPAKPRAGDEDLINATALQTLLHGGDVFVLPQDQVPGKSPMAAVLRW